jgi:hypothetical protein
MVKRAVFHHYDDEGVNASEQPPRGRRAELVEIRPDRRLLGAAFTAVRPWGAGIAKRRRAKSNANLFERGSP